VAAAAAWLLDPDEASWVTGQTVSVDGGLAGSILMKPAHLTSPEEFGEVLAMNLTSRRSGRQGEGPCC